MIQNIIVATPSPFREYIISNNLEFEDIVIYEKSKDFRVDYETKFLTLEINKYIFSKFNTEKSKCKYLNIDNINSAEFTDLISSIQRESRLILTGANFLKGNQYENVAKKINTRLNIHFGDPNSYRGLDSNLWLLLEDSDNYPSVTLHHVNRKLDTGEIVFQQKSKIPFKKMSWHELIDFEINGARECFKKAISCNKSTENSSLDLCAGIYKGAMSSEDKKKAFSKLKSL